MVRRFNIGSALLVAGSLFASVATPMAAMASTASSNLSVSASVSPSCTISTSALSFGSYDPVSANTSLALNGTGSVTTTCTNGASATIILDQGSNPSGGSSNAAPLRMMSNGSGNNLSYALYQDSARTTTWGNTAGTGLGVIGSGTSQTNTIYGSIAGGQNVPVGNYSDTVVATISF
ncbi:hypothetical protein B6N60_04408 [Richelia sinica FACHB-800]|uniref:Spore coat protein U/FanG domain-containing protein n=1 Tax=Richelia sinica FACHB-800 TaxID=1357546 RepID=A0A975TCU8_9NOST|nr:spore coat U domain-containing protein [Richelia sinica]MBD2665454.1 spore coat protein U domain-containing protein [Richelia sinica FACHB-800]QXE25688.1 hypothetical protein B6N60_04408 [Richelia sinica FACHB-800]